MDAPTPPTPARQSTPSETGTDFGTAAEAYRRGRPDYPAELVRWLVGEARTVADVGAGTGKLTGVLVGLGCAVTAIDPDARMLATLSEDQPTVTTHVGQAEDLPLADASVEAITYGQAWHWVDPPTASIEAARALIPGGTLGLIWNIRDETDPWVAELTATITSSPAEQLIASGGPVVTEPFGPAEHRRVEWTRAMTVPQLRDMVASRSYLIAAPPALQRDILDRATALAEKVADDTGTLTMPYRTEAFRFRIPA